MNVSGPWALVTGASSGIGWFISAQLAARSYSIIAVSNQPEKLESLKENLEQNHGVHVIPLNQDLAREDAAKRIFNFCQDQKLEPEILVNNAGMLMFGNILDNEYNTMRSILQLHMTTPALLCRLFAPGMQELGCGYILNVSSISSVMPYPTISVYGPSKTFLRYFTRAIRTELRPVGIHVTCLVPGATDTPLNDPLGGNMSLGRKIGLVKGPDTVARKAVRAMFRKRPICIPGLLNKLIILLLPLVPASFIAFIYNLRSRKLTKVNNS